MRKLKREERLALGDLLSQFQKSFLFQVFVEDTREIFDEKAFGVVDDSPRDVGEVLERERLIGECKGVRQIASWFASLEEQLIEQSDEDES